ncbi:MAG: Asp-tRNA(Asn)/Glu-tRNA(Gln) amidotransferase subunit GatA [Planctomycetota bacterium]|nr:MAG: Asp-tRNA(Asn)/Glu-tRNA(Gln) amidotransferase subunit GatA [Planctomycetota bacterium]
MTHPQPISHYQQRLGDGTSCATLITEACTRAEADNSGAVVRVLNERALAQATAHDQRRASGDQRPLDGVPVLIKDNLCLAETAVTAASRILEGWHAPYTATAVQRLEDAGAIVIGACNMDEFAMGSSNETSVYGPVANPHDPQRVPGGSSGGSAAAVASGLAPVALGSDTGGSIRQPASLCGCVGFKPSYGRVSRYGLIAFGSSLDQIGPLTTCVNDAALISQIMAGHDPLDSTVVERDPQEVLVEPGDLTGLRIGWIPSHSEGCDPAVQQALQAARTACEQAGATVVEVALPHEQYAVATYYIIATGEASSNLSRYDGVHYGRRSDGCNSLDEVYAKSRSQGFGAEVQRRIMLGSYVLSAGYYDAYYKRAQQVRALIINDFREAFQHCDVIIGPTSPTVAFARGEKTRDPVSMYLSDIYTIAANLAGIPAISIPGGADQQGLPIGVHLQAPSWHEGRLLRVAQALETLQQK